MAEANHSLPGISDVPRFTLGSASPRRSDLLASIGLVFDVEAVDIDEGALHDDAERDSHVVVERIAQAKFAAFARTTQNPVLLTADTLVACDGSILGKPSSDDHLVTMLTAMSGRSLTIATAVCVGQRGERPGVELTSTVVVLRNLMAEEIERYVATGAGMDKAGGLALQAQASSFIRSVTGCWSNVLGLPLCVATRLLGAHTASATARDHMVACSVELCGSHNG